MAEIIDPAKLNIEANSFKKAGEKLVLVGGCFDVLHPGHIVFLEKAKKAGDYLIILLESDEKVRLLKGAGRPVHTQKDRAQVLSALSFVDSVVMLPYMKKEAEYDDLIAKIKPDIIAATKGDKNALYHQRSAKLVGAKFKFVTGIVGNHSTSRILGAGLLNKVAV